jgi:transposase
MASMEMGQLVTVRSPRRRRSVEERRRIVEETLEPGASVARVAQRYGVNANQVFGWRRLYESGGLEVLPQASVKLLPVSIAEEPEVAQAQVSSSPSGTIHIELPGRALISVEGSVDAGLVRAVLKSLLS